MTHPVNPILTTEQAVELLKAPLPPTTGATDHPCPVCPTKFATRNALGPHKAAHLRDLGVAPSLVEVARRNRAERAAAMDKLTTRDSERARDRERKRLEREAAKAAKAAKGTEVAQVTQFASTNGNGNGHVEDDRPDALEISMAVLSKLSQDGRVAIRDLPEIVGWMEHTHRLATTLH
jgi:hypothetical protein